MGRGAGSTVPRLRWTRLIAVELITYAAALTFWSAFQLAQGATPGEAIRWGLWVPLPLLVLGTGFALYRRRQRYQPNPYGLTRVERESAADAMSPKHPIPTDPRIRDEALRLARDVQQQDGSDGRVTLVVVLIGVVGFGILGMVGSHWFLLSAAVLLPALLLVPVERGRRARLAELVRLDQAARTKT